MTKAVFIIFLFLFSVAKTQTHRFFYEVKSKDDSTQVEHEQAVMVLDINPEETKYYDYAFLEKDSVNKANNSQNTNWTSQIPIKRKKNAHKNINYRMIEFQLYSYPTDDMIDWKLSNETKKLAGFNVQKATTNFGGRKWTAWFTKEIPFSEGPYKFTGLPGLVVSIEDHKNQFSFNLIKSQKLEKTYDTSNVLEVRYGNSPLMVTEKIFVKKIMEYYNDPYYEVRNSLKNGTSQSFDYNGRRFTKPEELVPLIREEQEYIRKHNNPIELDKIIKYPMK